MKGYIKFLGTAGARFVVAKQLRSSAGIFIEINENKIILDPGPGTLVKCAKSRPKIESTGIDVIILTHTHLDHSNDVNIMIDAMTSGGLTKKGYLFAPEECLEGNNAVVLKYLRNFLERVVILKENENYCYRNISFRTSVKHKHPAETYGIIFYDHSKKISFLVDTKYFAELTTSYSNSDILVVNVVRYKPSENKNIMHLSIEDVKSIIMNCKPKRVIITHFGMTMLRAKPYEIARKLSDECSVDVTAAVDGLKIDI